MYDQNFCGGGVVDGEGVSSEGCLKKHLKTGSGYRQKLFQFSSVQFYFIHIVVIQKQLQK